MDESFDFVVVGSGGGSMCAALLMRAQGKSVVVLEKTDLVGGTTATSGGVMWIANNRFMAAEGIEDSRDKAIAYLDAVTGDQGDRPGTSRARRRAYVEEAPNMLDFLVAQGIKLRRMPSWPDYYGAPGASVPGRTVVAEIFDTNELGAWKRKLRPGFLPLPANLDEAMQLPWLGKSWGAKKTLAKVLLRTIAGLVTGKRLVTAGAALQGRMLKAALDAGAEVRVNAPVKQLIVEDGRVTGVVAGKDGADRRIGARLGVLINAGGFAHNQRMLDSYTPGIRSEWSNAAPCDTGEMIEEAARIGAALGQMDKRLGNSVSLPPVRGAAKPVIMQGDMSKPHTIVVDQTGVRYMNEACSYIEFAERLLARDKTVPASPSWMILDSQYLKNYMLAGTMGKKKPAAWSASGFLRRGDTIEDLAKACAIEPATLKATVERFNAFVLSGRDDDFHRGDWVYHQWLGDPFHTPSQTLGTIAEGPFFAVAIYPGDVSTLGGIVTDEAARALRPDGTVIAGLYATGTSAATVMAGGSPGAGASIGPSFTWGYVAAKHAAHAGNLAGASQEG